MDRLIDAAARAHGIGTVRCFADYFRTRMKAAAVAVRNLVDSGRLRAGHGSRLGPAPVPPRGGETAARGHRPGAASPFDSLVFERRQARGAVRVPLPDRDLHPGAEAAVRLLRAAVPAARRDRAPGSTSRRTGPAALLLARAAHAEARRTGGHRRRTRRGTAAHGRVAGTGRRSCLPDGGPGAGARRRRGCPVNRTYPL